MKQQPHKISLDEPAIYEINVQGIIGEYWLSYFNGMKISVNRESGVPITSLTGHIIDQAALQGMLQKIYSLGLVLIKVEREMKGE